MLSLVFPCFVLLVALPSSHAILHSNSALLSSFYAIPAITFVPSLAGVDTVIAADVAVEEPHPFPQPWGIHNRGQR
jgi:hypothetical protein